MWLVSSLCKCWKHWLSTIWARNPSHLLLLWVRSYTRFPICFVPWTLNRWWSYKFLFISNHRRSRSLFIVELWILTWLVYIMCSVEVDMLKVSARRLAVHAHPVFVWSSPCHKSILTFFMLLTIYCNFLWQQK